MANNNERWYVVVNPHAGNNAMQHDWPRVEAMFADAGFDFDAVFTEQPMHAVELTAEAISRGERKFVAVGGDGTFNEVANGIFLNGSVSSREITMATIPVGTGNDWGRMYGIPFDYGRAVEIIKANKVFVQDVGVVRYDINGESPGKRCFVNIAGTGFDALVARKTNIQKQKGKAGVFSYFLNLLSGLLEFKTGKVTLEIDSEKMNFNTFSITVGICRFNGGGMMQSPLAVPDDGLLDVTLIRKIGFFTIAMQLKNLYNGTFIRHPKIFTGRGEKIIVTPEKPDFILEVDGENLCCGPYEFSVLPRALNIVIGEKKF